MKKTKTYKVKIKESKAIQLQNGKYLLPFQDYWCRRIDNLVYIYGFKYGTELTIKQAKEVLEYLWDVPVIIMLKRKPEFFNLKRIIKGIPKSILSETAEKVF